jgi:hypothetical protein
LAKSLLFQSWRARSSEDQGQMQSPCRSQKHWLWWCAGQVLAVTAGHCSLSGASFSLQGISRTEQGTVVSTHLETAGIGVQNLQLLFCSSETTLRQTAHPSRVPSRVVHQFSTEPLLLKTP